MPVLDALVTAADGSGKEVGAVEAPVAVTGAASAVEDIAVETCRDEEGGAGGCQSEVDRDLGKPK